MHDPGGRVPADGGQAPERLVARPGDDVAPRLQVRDHGVPEPVLDDEDDRDNGRDQTQAICDAVVELSREGPGDVLVFLSGEREIRDTAEAVEALQLRNTEVLPLYARLSAAEQHRVFAPHPGRRIVLVDDIHTTGATANAAAAVLLRAGAASVAVLCWARVLGEDD